MPRSSCGGGPTSRSRTAPTTSWRSPRHSSWRKCSALAPLLRQLPPARNLGGRELGFGGFRADAHARVGARILQCDGPPFHRLDRIPSDAIALVVALAGSVLRLHAAQLGAARVPERRLGIFAGHPHTELVHLAEAYGAFGIAQLHRAREVIDGLLVVERLAVTAVIRHAERAFACDVV